MKPIKLMIAFTLVGFVFSLAACQQSDSPSSVEELRCEFQENPVGIDRMQPLLQWKIKDDRRGAKQTAWQVIVSSTGKNAEDGRGDVWDSGKIASD